MTPGADVSLMYLPSWEALGTIYAWYSLSASSSPAQLQVPDALSVKVGRNTASPRESTFLLLNRAVMVPAVTTVMFSLQIYAGQFIQFSLSRGEKRDNTQAQHARSQKRSRGLCLNLAKDRLSTPAAHFAVAPEYLYTSFAKPVPEVTSPSAASPHQQEDHLLHAEPKQQPTKETLPLSLRMSTVSKAALVQEYCLGADSSEFKEDQESLLRNKSKAGKERESKCGTK